MQNKKNQYRSEIDGIRAIAALSATIYNFNKDFLSSGYLGVDIFAVLSGYVITSSLVKRNDVNFKEFAFSFYKRRITRLLPALFFMVIISCLLISILAYTPRQSIFTGISSLFGISNIYLMQISSDYFSSKAELNPFTHTWSLGVEEQYYLIFPFIIWFSGYSQNKYNSVKKFLSFI